MFTHILLAADGSEGSLRAAKVAAGMAKQCGAKLTILTVYDPPGGAPSSAPDPNPMLDRDMVMRYIDGVLDEVEEKTCSLVSAEGVNCLFRRELGHVVESIVGIAAREKFDLIVMGSRGTGGQESFLVGSVAERVMHHAQCTVTIVK